MFCILGRVRAAAARLPLAGALSRSFVSTSCSAPAFAAPSSLLLKAVTMTPSSNVLRPVLLNALVARTFATATKFAKKKKPAVKVAKKRTDAPTPRVRCTCSREQGVTEGRF